MHLFIYIYFYIHIRIYINKNAFSPHLSFWSSRKKTISVHKAMFSWVFPVLFFFDFVSLSGKLSNDPRLVSPLQKNAAAFQLVFFLLFFLLHHLVKHHILQSSGDAIIFQRAAIYNSWVQTLGEFRFHRNERGCSPTAEEKKGNKTKKTLPLKSQHALL